MKKFLLSLLIIIVVGGGIFAYQNTYNSESIEFKALTDLCTLAGKSRFNMVTPISSEQMLQILESIDQQKLPETAQKIYISLKEKLQHPDVSITWLDDMGVKAKTDIAYEFYKQAEFDYDWLVPKKDRKPLLLVGADIFFNKNIFGNIDFDLPTGSYNNLHIKNKDHMYKPYADNMYKSVLEMIYTGPHRAYASVGYEGINLTLGRDRVALGNGKTGNMLIGDNFRFQDFLKASIVRGPLSYDFTAMSFGNSRGLDEFDDHYYGHPLDISTNAKSEELHQMVIVHNLSFKPVDWLSISLTEGALSFVDSVAMDLRKINPFFILHNTFDYEYHKNNGNMNNFFGFEINAQLPKHWTLDAQAIFDQIQVPAELGSEDLPQPAFGAMLTASKTMVLGKGISSFYFETAFTSPNLYLKEKDVACKQYWNVDLIVGNLSSYDSSIDDEVSYLGYKYGPDTLVFGCGFDWYDTQKIKVKADALFSMHGKQGIRFYESQNDTAVVYDESAKMDFIVGDIPEMKLQVSMSCDYVVTDYLTVSGTVGYTDITNYQNIKDLKHNDIQFAVSAALHLFEIKNTNKSL